jgi:hypothetical protein
VPDVTQSREPLKISWIVSPGGSLMKCSLSCVGLFLIGLIGMASSARSADIEAPSCSSADVQAAVDVAVDGDRVLVPACETTWSTTVRLINKAITLQGAGLSSTIITDMTGNAWNEPALWIEGLAGQSVRVSGFCFIYGLNATVQDYNGAIVVRGTSRQVRIDHNKFVDFWNRAMQTSGYTYGLIDHCIFEGTAAAVNSFQAINIIGDSDAAWERPLTLGSANAFYIEDNLFDFFDHGSAADSHSAGRFVFRMNTVTNGSMLNHGLDTTDRSSHSFEIYDNSFARGAYTFNIITIRGGTGVIYRNTITSPATIDIPIIAQLYRSCIDYPDTHGVRCNGTNPIDGNQDPTGYPCKDQHGRTSGQALSPIYVWQNTFNTAAVGMTIFDPWGCTNPSMFDHLVEGRDFFNDTMRPGHVPYQYPHPLTLSDYPGQQRSLDLQASPTLTEVQLSWQPVTGALTFAVLRDWQQVAQTASTGWNEPAISGEHVYVVYALDGSGATLAFEGRAIDTVRVFIDGFETGDTSSWSWATE